MIELSLTNEPVQGFFFQYAFYSLEDIGIVAKKNEITSRTGTGIETGEPNCNR